MRKRFNKEDLQQHDKHPLAMLHQVVFSPGCCAF